jgi:sulfate adenylyltransferase
MRLPGGLLFPIPITLDISKEKLAQVAPNGLGSNVALRDEEGNLLATLRIEDIWQADKLDDAFKVFGHRDTFHPGVAVMKNQHEYYIAGTLKGVQLPVHYDYINIRKTPRELREDFHAKQWDKIVAFQTRNPMHRAHRELTVRAIIENNAKLLIHPVVGMTKPGDVDYHTRVKCYKQIMPTYPANSATLSLLPLAMRMGGPREAIWHAIIRKNYGCTHFIVGRDHAGPGADRNGVDFYGPYDAQELLVKHEKELGMGILPFQMMVYVEKKATYYPADQVPEGEKTANISGTKLRKLLREGGDIPAWFSYPEVVEILRKSYPPKPQQGITLFFTGLSGSGKSTIANAVMERLLEEGSRQISLLDGDVVRTHLSSELGFSKEHRDLNIKRIGYVASEVTRARGIAICAPIAPYSSTRQYVRDLVQQHGNFVEVFVSTSLEECEKRDRKGLYAKARKGLIPNFTGVSDPYETPENPELTVDTEKISVAEAVEVVMGYLRKEGFLESRK